MRRSLNKAWVIAFSFFFFALLLPACNGGSGNWNRFKKAKNVLFVIHASSGHFELQGNNDTQGQLVLKDTNESVAFFTDKDSKESGSRSLAEFLSNWNQPPNSFSDNPPTAAFVYYRESDANNQNRAFEQINLKINHPQYNAGSDEVIFDFQLAGQGVHLPMGELIETTLFIDGKTWELPAASGTR